MKSLLLTLFLSLAASGCLDYEEKSAQGLPTDSGTIIYGGVEIDFYFPSDLIPGSTARACWTNLNAANIRVRVKNVTQTSTIIDDNMILDDLIGADAECMENALFAEDDTVTIEIWNGLESVYDSYSHGSAPDIAASATLAIGAIAVTPGTTAESFSLTLPTVRGVSCRLTGLYEAATPNDQRNQEGVCENGSSNSVRFQLYLLSGSSSPYSYNYEIMGGTIVEPLGEETETSSFSADLVPGQTYALRAYNVSFPLLSPVGGTEQTVILQLNVATNTVTILSGATASLPTPS